MDLLDVFRDDHFTLGLLSSDFHSDLRTKGPAQPQTQSLVRHCETNMLGSEV